MGYQIPKNVEPKITSTQDRLKRMGLFKDSCNGHPAMTTWEAIESALKELDGWRRGETQVAMQQLQIPRR